jgi:hypothetical protein
MRNLLLILSALIISNCASEKEKPCFNRTANTLLKEIVAEEVTKQAYIQEMYNSMQGNTEAAILSLYSGKDFAIELENLIRAEYSLYFNGEPNELEQEDIYKIENVKTFVLLHMDTLKYIRPVSADEFLGICNCKSSLILSDNREIELEYSIQETEDNIFVEIEDISNQVTLDHFNSISSTISDIINNEMGEAEGEREEGYYN